MPIKNRLIPFVIIFCLIVVIGIIIYFIFSNKKDNSISNSGSAPTLKHLGIEFADYNASTERAGDFVFSKEALRVEEKFGKRIFIEFGYVQQGGMQPAREFTYYFLARGTKIKAAADGQISVEKEKSGDDYVIFITQPGSDGWIVSHDHISDPAVKNGDVVKAGDVIGTAVVNNLGFDGASFTELHIIEGKGTSNYTNHCPLSLFDPALKDQVAEQVKTLMMDWEKFAGNENIYEEEKQILPGCNQLSFKE